MNVRVLLCFCLSLAGCATLPDSSTAPRELLTDPTFSKWFEIRGLGQTNDDRGVKGVFRTVGKVGSPTWSIAQWASKHNLADASVTTQTQLGKRRFEIVNPSKRIEVDCSRGEIALGLSASACYEHPRQPNEPWPHLLIETSLTDTRYPSHLCRVADMARLDLALSCRLDAFADKHVDADPHLHAAQFQLFLVVQNLNVESPGYGDLLWFGVPVFDNRYPVREESYQRDGGKPDASGKFIYTLPTKACLSRDPAFVTGGQLLEGKRARWVDVRIDAAPWIVYAYQLARKNGYLPTTDFNDLYVSSLNLGWEMPGSYDATMRVRGLSLKALSKPSQP